MADNTNLDPVLLASNRWGYALALLSDGQTAVIPPDFSESGIPVLLCLAPEMARSFFEDLTFELWRSAK